jgi:uncharacterized protein (DUF983 family)
MRLVTLLWRAARRRCPDCGGGKLFQSWFRMRPHCSQCGASFERPDGFFLGSIYVNYAVTGLAVAIGYPLALFVWKVNERRLLFGALAFALFFPLWFFRYARSLWMAIDRYFDPGKSS